MKGYIYKYTFADGKVYIGQTRRSPEVRHREHLNESIGKTNPGFWEAYQKLGEPAFEIIETIEDNREMNLVDKLNIVETYYIDLYQATAPQHGYNRKSSGTVASQDMMKLNDAYQDLWDEMIEPHHAYFNSVLSKIFQKTVPLTDEEKAFVRKNIMVSNNIFYHRVKDYNLDDLSSNTGDDDFWMEEAYEGFLMDFDEIASQDISSYIYENSDSIILKKSKGRIIQQLDMDGNVIREYGSNGEVVQALNIARIDNVLNVLKGRQKTAYGFRWKYKDSN